MTAHEDYPGQLDMLRGLIATIRAVAEHGDIADVRKLLDEHQSDEQDAIAASIRTALPVSERRLAQLLDTIRTLGGRWPAGRVQDLRRLTGGATQRSIARRDLAELHRRGHLDQNGPRDGRYYTLRRKVDR
ncbi:hypothetical protein [Streptomyces sp. YIM S03343]